MTEEQIKEVAFQFYPIFLEDNGETIENQIKLIKAFTKGVKYASHMLNGRKDKKVFLGGTCADTTWREELIPMLKIDYFNPVVDDWDEECQNIENYEKKHDLWQLYVITPQIQGIFGIAEAVQSSRDDAKHTIFCVLKEHQGKAFDKPMLKSVEATANLIKTNGAYICNTLEEVADILNHKC